MRKLYAVSAVIVLLLCQSAFAADESYIIGRVRNGTYTNQSLGARAYFGENWIISSLKEIAEDNGVTLSDSPTLSELTNGDMPVFFAKATDGTANISVMVINLGVMGSEVVSKSVNELIDLLIKYSSESFSRAYEAMGFKGFKMKRANVKFLGKKYPGVTVNAQLEGINVYVKQAICIKGEYSYHITATSAGLDMTDKLLAMFRRTGSR